MRFQLNVVRGYWKFKLSEFAGAGMLIKLSDRKKKATERMKAKRNHWDQCELNVI